MKMAVNGAKMSKFIRHIKCGLVAIFLIGSARAVDHSQGTWGERRGLRTRCVGQDLFFTFSVDRGGGKGSNCENL